MELSCYHCDKFWNLRSQGSIMPSGISAWMSKETRSRYSASCVSQISSTVYLKPATLADVPLSVRVPALTLIFLDV